LIVITRTRNKAYTSAFAGDDFTFHFDAGITSISISTKLWGPYASATPGEAKYLGLVTVPNNQLSQTPLQLKDRHTIIDWNGVWCVVPFEHRHTIIDWSGVVCVMCAS